MTKVMFILSSVSSGSVNHMSIYENSELKVIKNITFLGEISNSWTNYVLETNVYRTLESSW